MMKKLLPSLRSAFSPLGCPLGDGLREATAAKGWLVATLSMETRIADSILTSPIRCSSLGGSATSILLFNENHHKDLSRRSYSSCVPIQNQ